MNILGITAFVHDSAACLVIDGQVVANAEEERFNREKHTQAFPAQAIRYVLEAGRIAPHEIDLVTFNWNPWTSLLHELGKALCLPLYLKILKYNRPPKNFTTIFSSHRLRRHLQQCLGEKISAPIKWVGHHQAHAAASYCLSPFHEADILVVDGHGENASTSCYSARGNTLTRQWTLPILSSLGILYRNFTQYLGFHDYQEGVIMALAAYGRDAYKDFFNGKVKLLPNGKIRIHSSCMGWWHYLDGAIAKELGPLRRSLDPLTQRDKDIAASLQACVKNSMLHMVRHLAAKSNRRNLCLGGGVFLNCDINKSILESECYDRIFIPPFTSDSGGAMGSALWGAVEAKEELKKDGAFFSPYWGPEYGPDVVESAFVQAQIPCIKSSRVCRDAAQILADGKIVGWFQGRMESGPRALGNRSILAAPFDASTRDRLNDGIKKRENFRPFAPVLTEEAAEKYFEVEAPLPSLAYYMLLTVHVRPEYRERLAAVVHVDGSSRIQVVTASTNERLHRLLCEFEKLTGCAMLLNTSFNVKEPIVCSPRDALRTYKASSLDALVMGDYVADRDSPQVT
ncbi:MAG TPA: hypothetical protein DCZ95_04190 [Verrucomicrobia bacterium]|nr:MAG: hypothetical protein A2X46_15225 [Lentisphaerae bacterium GWF2_57_35]HBA83275.1 hypothetical protein [Verrucomicrobiota bacterium]